MKLDGLYSVEWVINKVQNKFVFKIHSHSLAPALAFCPEQKVAIKREQKENDTRKRTETTLIL